MTSQMTPKLELRLFALHLLYMLQLFFYVSEGVKLQSMSFLFPCSQKLMGRQREMIMM